MSHKFDSRSSAKLDNEERRKRLPAETILQKFGVSKGNIIADIGCGIGYFTLPASMLVGPEGKVFAMDISNEMLKQTQEKANLAETGNIETMLISENNFLLREKSVDVALVFFVLHEAQSPEHFIAEIHRIIKPGGKLAILDWEKRGMPQGPPIAHRISSHDAAALMQNAGFSTTTVDIGTEFYGLLGLKPEL